jgi:O-antigen ligase
VPTIAARLPVPPPHGAARRCASIGTLFGLASVLGMATAVGLGAVRQPAGLLLAGGLGLLGVLALAVARYDAAVALGFLTLAVVQFEPAPSDGIFAVVIAVALVTGRFRLRAPLLGPALGISAFVLLNLLACMEVIDQTRAVTFLSITVYLLVFALWIATWVTDRGRARTVVRIYVGIAVASAAIGSLALFLPLPGHDLLTAYTGTRARALFKDPNVFGPFLVPALLILVSETLEPRLLRSGRLVKLAGLGVLTCGVLFSYSRAAWLNVAVAAAVMGVVLTLRRGGARRGVVFAAVIVVALLTAVASIQLTGQGAFLQERARYQSYDTQRFGTQSSGVALSERYPLGVGPGQFELYEPISAHSTFVRALGEEGVLGFVVLAAILFGTLLLAMRNAVRGSDTHGIASTALLAAWCGILANSVFVDTLHWRHLWLVAALIWAVGGRAQTSASAGTPLSG